ncbi:MAG: hypothetical protein M1269_11390 [Chloroflexi bacterium]|nr:hypothetical protein [Chloroflexota bacterium]
MAESLIIGAVVQEGIKALSGSGQQGGQQAAQAPQLQIPKNDVEIASPAALDGTSISEEAKEEGLGG